MPKLARDYFYKMVIPVAKRYGMFVNEYPSLERIYEEETKELHVCSKPNNPFPFIRGVCI